MTFALTPPPVPWLAVTGGAVRFAVRRIYCVGRNYAEHAREMRGPGQDADDRAPPFFFGKPADAVVAASDAQPAITVPYPPATQNLHHEVELVVALSAGGRDLTAEQAEACIFGYAIGLDLTRRDLQATARKVGQPWDMAKGFDASAPCSAITPAAGFAAAGPRAITLAVNGRLRQRGDLAEMTWKVPEILAKLSSLVALASGDLVFTGTPAGVGPLVPGDVVHAHIDGLPDLQVTILQQLINGASDVYRP